MPDDTYEFLDPDEFLKLAEQDVPRDYARNGTATRPVSGGPNKWKPLFESHGEGGGPFGGRNNALTVLVGFLRGKRFPYEAALSYAAHWNHTYCDPPLSEREVDDRVGRAWHEWAEGDAADATPEELKAVEKPKPERRLLSTNDLLDMEESGHGLEWLVPNVFVKGGIHFVSAPAAGAKSWLMLDLSRCVSSGDPWLSQYEIEQGAVLYVDEEMGENKTSTRIKKLGFDRDTPFYYVGKQGLRLTSVDDRKFIVDTIQRLDVKLVCVDTLTGVVPGLKENESEHVSMLRAYFNEFTQAGATVLVAHHDRKGGQGDSNTAHERMAGSRDFGAMADMAYGIDKRGSVFHLSVTKNRWLSEDEALSVDFVLEDNDDRTQTALRVLTAEERIVLNQQKAKQSVEDLIGDALANGPLSTTDLIGAVDGSANLTLAVAKGMAEKGTLMVEKRGKAILYSLPPL